MGEEMIGAETPTTQKTVSTIELTNNIAIPLSIREKIAKKAEELKAQHKLRKIFVVVVQGEEDDEKPFYIGYFRRPGLIHFSQYMSFIQKDIVQANKMLASNTFIAGDRELVEDEDIFLYGTMQQISNLIDSRSADLVKK